MALAAFICVYLRSSAVFFLVFCASAVQDVSAQQVVPIFDEAEIAWDKTIADGTQRHGLKMFNGGQVIEATVDLPSLPGNQRDARRIIATLIVEPAILEEDDKVRPGDPWTRLGNVSVIGETPSKPAHVAAAGEASPAANEIEILRFITGFGGHGTFTQDVTTLAPLLHGKTTIRAFISTYKNPAWKVTLTLTYSDESPGYRRPLWARSLFNEPSITAEKNKVQATIDVPPGLARPRLRIMSTGHATDGTGGDEFISRTHILRIDGVEVARWRPWSEDGGPDSHAANPASGRINLDGRELWSSDLDRSGWRPGSIVQPIMIPVPELTPGKHTIELEIVGIRPKDQLTNHGYWRASCIAVADEPWPEMPESR
jgi:hypothetical protein